MFDTDSAGLVLGIVGLVTTLLLGIVAYRIAVKTKREQWQIAEASGAFRKANLGLSIFGRLLGEGYPDNEWWCFIHPGESDEIAVFPIRFYIFNAGDAKSDIVDVVIRVPEACFPESAAKYVDFSILPSLLQDSIDWSVDTVDHFTQLSFTMPPMEPKSVRELEIPFGLRPSVQGFEVGVPHTTSSSITVSGMLVAAYVFTVRLRSRDSEPLDFSFKVVTIPARNMRIGIYKYVELCKRDKTLQSEYSAFRRLRDMLTTVAEPRVANFLAFKTDDEETTEFGKIYTMKLPKTLRQRVYYVGTLDTFENPAPGTVISLFDFQSVPRSSRRFRKEEGNVVRIVG